MSLYPKFDAVSAFKMNQTPLIKDPNNSPAAHSLAKGLSLKSVSQLAIPYLLILFYSWV